MDPNSNDIYLSRETRQMNLFYPISVHILSLLPKLSSIINAVILTFEKDSIQWMPSQSSKFTVNSYHKILNDGGLRSTFYKSIGKCVAPSKVKIFT